MGVVGVRGEGSGLARVGARVGARVRGVGLGTRVRGTRVGLGGSGCDIMLQYPFLPSALFDAITSFMLKSTFH